MNDAYRMLIDQFCKTSNLQPPEPLDGLFNLAVGGVLFFVSPLNDGDGVRLQLTVHYGELPSQAPALAYCRLLEANVQVFDSMQPKFGIDAETGSVIATGTLPLASLTVDSLSDLVLGQASMVREWRENNFLTPEERARSQASARTDAASAAAGPRLLRASPSRLGR